ncbi:glycosyltransferase family 4 protein [Mycobacterium seoulense]|uniref:glycosyltransferase family 4 protein n=1 Tax=Mycobacterium seoulense TaxID=386911 RepID=UPI0013D1F7E6|nr:glycosyltransferase family 4 protein [Mycobacterium seoulense]MCV7437305.1 glycosyltransferase family 4 protein [Mycobacterium seoulense]
MRPLRVALVGDYPVDEGAAVQNGVQSVTYTLAHALAARPDVECHVVSAMNDVTTTYRRAGALHVHYVKRLNLPRLITLRVNDVPRLAAAIRSINPDVVHGQGQDRHALGALASRAPAVITPHGVLFIESRLLQKNRWDVLGALKKRAVADMEREVFRRARDMIIISPYLAQVYGSMLTARCRFIENPIQDDFFRIQRAPEAGRTLFVGTLVPRKGVHHLVRAIGEVVNDRVRDEPWRSHLQFRIAGPVADPGSELEVRRAIAECGLQGRVRLLGPISHEELLDEYARAQVLLMGSREETTPQAVAQAMACGLPVIASRVGGIPDMVEDGRTALLFPYGDVAACAGHIRRMLDDDALRARIERTVRVEAQQRFDPKSVADQTVCVYREVIARDLRI